MKKKRSRAEQILDLAEELAAVCQASDLTQVEIRNAWDINAKLMESCDWFTNRPWDVVSAAAAASQASAVKKAPKRKAA